MKDLSYETQQAYIILTADWQLYEGVLQRLSNRIPFTVALKTYTDRAAMKAGPKGRVKPPLSVGRQVESGARAKAVKVIASLVRHGRAETRVNDSSRYEDEKEIRLVPLLEGFSIAHAAILEGVPSVPEDLYEGPAKEVRLAAGVVVAKEVSVDVSDDLLTEMNRFQQSVENFVNAEVERLESQVQALMQAVTPRCSWAWEHPSGVPMFRPCGVPAMYWAVDSLIVLRAPMLVCERHGQLARVRGCQLQPIKGRPRTFQGGRHGEAPQLKS